MGVATGLYFTFGEVGGFLGPYTIGYVKDLTGSFNYGLNILVALTIILAPLTLLLKKKKYSEK